MAATEKFVRVSVCYAQILKYMFQSKAGTVSFCCPNYGTDYVYNLIVDISGNLYYY